MRNIYMAIFVPIY